MFKENDFIAGLPINKYNYTNEDMLLAVVLEVFPNKEMSIMIFKHVDVTLVFGIFRVSNTERFFKLKEDVSKEDRKRYLLIANQIKGISYDKKIDTGVSLFNLKFGISDSMDMCIPKIRLKINKTKTKNLNILEILNNCGEKRGFSIFSYYCR